MTMAIEVNSVRGVWPHETRDCEWCGECYHGDAIKGYMMDVHTKDAMYSTCRGKCTDAFVAQLKAKEAKPNATQD